jgi:hypothetical protein
MNLKGDIYFDHAKFATYPGNKLIISKRRRTRGEQKHGRGTP